MIEFARITLERNWRDGYTVPSPRLYPFQWNWDSGFISLGHVFTRPERAIQEIQNMFRGQWRNGMLPHINFHRPDPNYFPGPEVWQTAGRSHAAAEVPTSGITQPPVFAFVVERISQSPFGQTPEWREFLWELLPQIIRFHHFLYTQRDPLDEGLVCIFHNWEAGTDNSPIYDEVLGRINLADTRDVSALRRDTIAVDAKHRPSDANYRRYISLIDLFIRCGYDDRVIAAETPFLVQDVLFNALLVRSNFALLKLGAELGVDTGEIAAWNTRTILSINRKLWDPAAGFYFAYDVRSNQRIQIKTSSGLMPLFAGICSPTQRDALAGHLEHSFVTDRNWTLCPSTAADEPTFDPIKYWRGPVWVNVNWMLYHGLLNAGLAPLAERVKQDTLSLLAQEGMWEYFDPRPATLRANPAGLGIDGFSWTAALALDWLNNPNPL